MNEFVESKGYTVHENLRATLERTIELNEKQPNEELWKTTVDQLRELVKNANLEEPEEEQSDSVDELIHALRCCAELDCKKCPRFVDDGDNYPTLCNQALMQQAAVMLEELR